MLWLMLMLGCADPDTGDTDADCPDADEDGVCDAQDQCPGKNDGVDRDEDGTPDGCQLDPVGSFSTIRTLVPTTSTELEVQLAYDTDGALSTWTIFEPPLVVGEDAPHRVETSSLSGWDDIEERLTDDTLALITVRIVGVQDGQKASQVYEESKLPGLEALQGVRRMNEVEVSASRWEWENEELGLVLQWSFYGVP